jgi:hypothetical protein
MLVLGSELLGSTAEDSYPLIIGKKKQHSKQGRRRASKYPQREGRVSE